MYLRSRHGAQKEMRAFFSIMVYRRTGKRDIVSMWEDGVTASLISKI